MSGSSAPNPPNRLLTWLLWLLALVGPPTVGLTFAHISLSWQTLGGMLLYEVLILLIGFMAVIWQQLQNNWSKRIADRIDRRLLAIMPGYQKRYCRLLIEQHNQFDVGGLSIYDTPAPTLDKTFVELNFVDRPPYQISPTTFKAPEPLPSASQHPVSYFLEKDQNHLVVLGSAGSGKTTFLRRLGLSLVERKQKTQLPYKLPFFLSLRDYGNIIKEQEQISLIDAVQTPLRKENLPAPPGWIERRLMKGRCLILLDGLDEVPDPETRQAVARWVETQMRVYGHNNRFILTSRPHGYQENPISGYLRVLEVQGFNYTQIKDFVHNWYRAEEENRPQHTLGSFENVKHEAEAFLRRLQGMHTLYDLASNPLLLTMSILLDRCRGVLPGSRGELYKEICEVFLGRRQRQKGLKLELSAEQNQLVLQPLAFYMMEKEKEELTPAEAYVVIEEPLKSVSTQLTPQAFLKTIEDSNIWVKQGPDAYGFSHLSFQEYLAAMHVKEKKLEKVLVKHIGLSWWHETMILYCYRADASTLIKECLTRKPLSVSALQLAIACKEAASQSSSIEDPSVRTLYDRILIQGIEDANPEIWLAVAEAYLAKRIKEMIHLDNEVSITTSLVSCAEYQLFLDEQQQRAYYQPDHWTSRHFPPGQGQAPALGTRPSDALAFCAWLTERDRENWYYRLPQKSEQEKIEEFRDEKGNLTAGTGYWINEGRELAWVKGDPPEWSKRIQETISRISFLDSQQALTYSPHLENKSERYLAESLSWARELAEVRSLIDRLIRSLRAARNRIRSEEDTLDKEYKRSSIEAINQQNELRYIEQKERRLWDQISIETGRINRLESELKQIEQQESTLKSKTSPRLQANQRTSRFPHQSEANQQPQPHSLNELKDNTPKMSQENLIAEKKALSEQLKIAQNSKQTLETEFGNLHPSEIAQQIKLQQAENHKQSQKEKLDNFRAQTHSFTSDCDRLLSFTRFYKRDSVFSEIFERRRILNFDQVLVNINNGNLEETLAYVSSRADNFTRRLIDLYKSNLKHIHTSADDSHVVPTLDHLLAKTSLSERSKRLINILWTYLGSLNQHRPLGRSNPVPKLMRSTIRYFAGELAEHLAYWSWKKYFSEEEQGSNIDQHSLGILFDISVTFAILEARIEGRLPAYEGIIIVKQRREYEQQQDETNTL